MEVWGIFTGRNWLFPVAYCPGDGSRQGARVEGEQPRELPVGEGRGREVGRSGAQRQKGRFYGEDLRGKERGSPEPCRVWETPGQEKLDATIRRSWASCHVILGGDWLGRTVAGGRSHVIS